jgi:gliding motility-associated-like protein
MIRKLLLSITISIAFVFNTLEAQNVSLYQQFNGRYDFTFIGNTLNPDENSNMLVPQVLTTSDAILALSPSDEIEAAYLYWAGSGTGDLEVKLNNTSQTPDRVFNFQRTIGSLVLNYFSAFKDVTTLVKSIGNTTYTISEFDVSPFINDHFIRRTNFAGWAIIIVYKNPSLPLNQLTVYDGLQAVPSVLNITLNNLNVIDNIDAKIGFIAWEGDSSINDNESLRFNGNILSNAINPPDNAFNSTNTITGATNLYNMDLDVYDIQNNISIGDTSATIQLTSDQDFVMINAIVTKLNSQLPDATIATQNISQECDTRKLIVNYRVSNTNSTKTLPANTYITAYANNIAVATTQTTQDIPIGEFRNYQITLVIPANIPANFVLKFIVDDNNGVASIPETNENNNNNIQNIELWLKPSFNLANDYFNCKEDNNNQFYNFSEFSKFILINNTDVVTYFETYLEAVANSNPITNTSNYELTQVPKTIFTRIQNNNCYSITSFVLNNKFCQVEFYNLFNPNLEDFFITGLLDLYPNYEIEIYNRWGVLVWKGDKNLPKWDGTDNQNVILITSKLPAGTYFYVLNFNDSKITERKVSWVFLSY